MAPESVAQSRLVAAGVTVRERLQTTGSLSLHLLGRRDSLSVFLGVTVGYLFAFLYMMQNVFIQTGAGFGVSMPVESPLSHMFQRAPGRYTFEPVALVDLGIVTWTFSPLNTLIGLTISVLVGLNLALTYLAVTQPKACGLGATSGVFASVPALLAGSACCAPVLALVFGLQMSALMLTAFAWLLPVGVALLLASLVYVAGKVDPT